MSYDTIPQPHGRGRGLPPSPSHHSGLNNLAGLADWRHKQRQQKQLGAAKVPVPANEAGQGVEVGAAGAEEVEEENLPPVQHKARGAGRLRALDEVLSVGP